MIANNNAITDMIDMIDRIALGMGVELPRLFGAYGREEERKPTMLNTSK